MADLDWAEMEGLFCQQAPPINQPATSSTPYGPGADADRRRREPTEVCQISTTASTFLKEPQNTNRSILFILSVRFSDCSARWKAKLER